MENAELVRVLSSLQHRADSKNTTSEYSWAAISKIYQNVTGQDLDYNTFKMIFDKDAEIKNLVQNFNKFGVTIKTKEKELPTEFGQPPKANNAAALRAADNVLQQPG